MPVLHHLSHLPVVADPSHATGYTRYVEPMALCRDYRGANGLEIEVHDEPSRAWSDGAQALTLDQFDDTMRRIWRHPRGRLPRDHGVAHGYGEKRAR
ncbi:MAG: hypothetical protein ACLU0O_06645 [Collinsella sp.]